MLKARLTQQGYDKLQAELEALRERRRKVVAEIGAAREEGDLNENAGYHAAREARNWLEFRIQLLEQKLADAEIVDVSQVPTAVEIGVTVTTLNLDSNEERVYTLVDGAELNMRENPISAISPLGRTLLGKSVGDVVEVQVPRGLLRLEVVGLSLE